LLGRLLRVEGRVRVGVGVRVRVGVGVWVRVGSSVAFHLATTL